MMDTPRLVLLVIFCISLFMLGENWYKTYGPKPVSREAATAPNAKGDWPRFRMGPIRPAIAEGDVRSPVPDAAPGASG